MSRGVDIVLRRQPPGSHSCGQHCVAMLTGGDLDRVVKVFGHDWCTRWSEISKALRTLGVRAMPFPASIKKQSKPTQCIVRVKSKQDPGWSHFVIFSHGHWWDPVHGTAEGQKRHPLWQPHMYQASYLEILGYAPEYREPQAKPIRPVQPSIYAEDWDKMTIKEKNVILARVFGVEEAATELGPAQEIMHAMTARGFSIEWTPRDESGGVYCLLDEKAGSHVGYGKTLSESLCTAALVATGFLLQRGRPANKFKADESKAKAETQTSTRPQLR